jgi:hypothetical protein
LDVCRRGAFFCHSLETLSGLADLLSRSRRDQDPETGKITDLFAFYSLPSTATKVTPKTLINAAYLFYYATTACPSCANLGDGSKATPVTNWKDETEEERAVLKERLKLLVGDALTLAAKVSWCGSELVGAGRADDGLPSAAGL